MDNINVEDINILFSRTLVLYKGEPVFVHKNAGREVLCEFIETGKVEKINFNLKDFKPISHRLGYVNTAVGCAYLMRKPVRRYQVGLSYDNIQLLETPSDFYMEIKTDISTLRSRFIVDTIKGEYPDIDSCYMNAVALNTTFAFDRQFAVTYEGRLYYRGREFVGNYRDGEILFNEGKEYLNSLLDGSYGKNC